MKSSASTRISGRWKVRRATAGCMRASSTKGKIYKQEDGTKIIRYRVETGDSHIWQLDYELNTSGTVDAIRWSYEP